jgi:hypothetical protein
MPALATAQSTDGPAPKPIPGGFQPFGPGTEIFHVFPPNPNNKKQEPLTITDFNGFFGLTEIGGMGTGTDTNTGAHTRLVFDVDVRFMKGLYIGVDGHHHRGTFCFI